MSESLFVSRFTAEEGAEHLAIESYPFDDSTLSCHLRENHWSLLDLKDHLMATS
jgi:hypothetical protein